MIHYGQERVYFRAEVIKVSKTRFTVKYGNGNEKVFNKDSGSEYPRPQGFGRSYCYIKHLDEDGLLLIKKSRLSEKAHRLCVKLSSMVSHTSFRESISNSELSDTEIEESIDFIESAIKRLEKYV
jgi:hypothetical protein